MFSRVSTAADTIAATLRDSSFDPWIEIDPAAGKRPTMNSLDGTAFDSGMTVTDRQRRYASIPFPNQLAVVMGAE
jgi:hypothetical protein